MSSQSLIQIFEFLETYNVTFVENIPDRLKCVICKDILKNAKQTTCGCKACNQCITTYLGDGDKPCPSNQTDCQSVKLTLDTDINQDNATNKEISNLIVECPFINCNNTDFIRIMVSHVNICEYREVMCDKCNKKYPQTETDDHYRNKCDERTVCCESCFKSMSYFVLHNSHLNIDNDELCSKYISVCPNGCSKKKVNVRDHLVKCPNKKFECPLKPLSCDVTKLTLNRLNKHLQNEYVSHLNMLVSEIKKEAEINKTLMNEMAQLQEKIKQQMSEICEFTQFRLKMETSIVDLQNQGPRVAPLFEKTVFFRNACYIWKIQHFESLKSSAENSGRATITSDPFYTSDFGYKMCMRLYPAGDGVGRGNYLSVFFAVMKGDFDDILSWPFSQKVTLSLLDQVSGGAKNHTDTFKPDARSACYQKPIDDYNIASGSPKFIQLSSLFPVSTWYKNDTIYFKISVDTTGISSP